jgi:hypothetical protein
MAAIFTAGASLSTEHGQAVKNSGARYSGNSCVIYLCGPVAQWKEHMFRKLMAVGSPGALYIWPHPNVLVFITHVWAGKNFIAFPFSFPSFFIFLLGTFSYAVGT